MSVPERSFPCVQVIAFDSNGARLYKEPLEFLVVNKDKIRVDELFKVLGQHLRYQSPDGIVVGSDGSGYSNLPFPAGSVVDIYAITEKGVWNWKGFGSLFHRIGRVFAGREAVNKDD